MQLDPKGLEAARTAVADLCNTATEAVPVAHVEATVRAYLESAPSPSPAPVVVGKNRAQGMVRSMDQWRNMVPLAVMSGSMAQIEYALIDAKHDIEMLWLALASLSQPAKEGEGGGQPMLSPEEEAAIVEDINSGRWPYLQPLSGDGPPVISTPANPAQGVSELVEDLEQAVIDFENARPDTYKRAKVELQRARAALTAAIGAGGAEPSLLDRERAAMDVTQRRAIEAESIADAVLGWMVKYDLLDAGNEYHAADVLAVLNDLAPSAAIGAGGQAVAWWHVGKWGNGTSCADESNIFCDAWETAIAENLPTEIAEAIVEAHNAALASVLPADGWRTMDTAPKDGTKVVLAEWDDYNKQWVFGVSWWRKYLGEGEGFGWAGHKPSHWMPLPASPTGGR